MTFSEEGSCYLAVLDLSRSTWCPESSMTRYQSQWRVLIFFYKHLCL